MTVQAEQSIIMKSHIYLSSIKPENRTCFLCKIRKSMVCVKCGSCLLCHPFTERIEARKPGFCTGIAMLCDIESPALSEIKRWNSLSFGFRTPKCGCRVHSLATTTNSQGKASLSIYLERHCNNLQKLYKPITTSSREGSIHTIARHGRIFTQSTNCVSSLSSAISRKWCW